MAPPKKKTHRINTKGPLRGQCNVCGEIGKLTEDHTPPKSCRGLADAELNSLHDKLSAVGERWHAPRRFQAGVCYRTLCERCNGLLGTNYDPALAAMCAQVRGIAGSSLVLPQEIELDISPGAVMRSVLGHLSAQGVDRYAKGPITEPLRDYILDESAPLPTTLRVYYWFYPYRRQVLIRDAASMSIKSDAVFGFWLMKFFPLAFFVTIDEPNGPIYPMAHFDDYRNAHAKTSGQKYLHIRHLIPGEWPERPDDDGAILYGQEAMVAEPVPRARR
jgi:hypothetical protein